MKKIFTLLIMAILVLTVFVSAAEVESTSEVELDVKAGITPDSALYGLDKAMDRISLALSFNAEKRAQKALKIAEERLAEAQEMQKQNKIEAAAKAQEGHAYAFGKLETTLRKMKEKSPENDTDNVMRIENRIEVHAQKVADVKARIMLKMQDNNMTQEQRDHIANVFERIQIRAEGAKGKVVDKNQPVRNRIEITADLDGESELNTNDSEYQEKSRKAIRTKSETSVDSEIDAGSNDTVINVKAGVNTGAGLN